MWWYSQTHGGWMVVGAVWMLLFWGAVLWLIAWGIKKLSNGRGKELTAKQILDQRYARGEITREQYEVIKRDVQA